MARKILLADDSVTAQNMGRKILADAGYEVITVNNGSAALKKIAELKPDLIVLDVYMPGYSGLEVCQRLKEAGETARIPVLLTVGKLEPFKPEEAKRARADGFIVKPFEASELLSALAKLEDKIVPRSESSKPGRFARSIAAIEEGRYDKTMAQEEDSGWKNRIAFPPKKKGKSLEEGEGDDPAIYNAVNKDLRTVIATPTANPPAEAKPAEMRVDVGALAAQGLPKDVTPEEIAALAAAAAQVQSTVEASKNAEAVAEIPRVLRSQETREEEKSAVAIVAAEPGAGAQAEAEAAKEVALAEAAEAKIEAKLEAKSEEKVDAVEHKASEVAAPVVEAVAPPSAVAETNLGGAAVQHDSAPHADEPVTMAVAAGSEAAPRASRWTAVAVALGAEETAVSLEKEMQKAFAAFAAADGAHAEFAPAHETSAVAVAPFSESATANAPVEMAATPVPEVRQAEAQQTEVQHAEVMQAEAKPTEAVHTLEAVASAATEAVTAAIRELEAAAASYVGHGAASSTAEPSRALETRSASDFSASISPSSTSLTDFSTNSAADSPSHTSSPEPQAMETPTSENRPAEAVTQESGVRQERQDERELVKEAEETPAVVPQAAVEESHPAASPAEMATAEFAVPEIAAAAEVVSTNKHDSFDSPAVHEAAAVPAAHGLGDLAKKESEIAAHTAAAWASWRRTRDSDDPRAAGGPQDSAAMAVAAGAEHNPEGASAGSESDSEGIANIVDSVLADLRPKIVEEISRKLGKKKQ